MNQAAVSDGAGSVATPSLSRYRRALASSAPSVLPRWLRVTFAWSSCQTRSIRFASRPVRTLKLRHSRGLPRSFTAERYTDKGELKPWGGVYRDWAAVSGMQVPFEADVTWQLDSGPYTYARWWVEAMDFDERPGADNALELGHHPGDLETAVR